jgi:hypothetical protein
MTWPKQGLWFQADPTLSFALRNPLSQMIR